MDPYIGEIRLFAGTFAPRDWAFCDGSLLIVDDYQALFSLFAYTYGGDGATTFGLPDLRGRLPIGVGQGPGLAGYSQGQLGGDEVVMLTPDQLMKHSHALNVSGGTATTPKPGQGVVPAVTDPLVAPYSHRASADGDWASYAPQTVGVAGGYQAHSNMMPSVGLNFIVSLAGTYPSQ